MNEEERLEFRLHNVSVYGDDITGDQVLLSKFPGYSREFTDDCGRYFQAAQKLEDMGFDVKYGSGSSPLNHALPKKGIEMYVEFQPKHQLDGYFRLFKDVDGERTCLDSGNARDNFGDSIIGLGRLGTYNFHCWKETIHEMRSEPVLKDD